MLSDIRTTTERERPGRVSGCSEIVLWLTRSRALTPRRRAAPLPRFPLHAPPPRFGCVASSRRQTCDAQGLGAYTVASLRESTSPGSSLSAPRGSGRRRSATDATANAGKLAAMRGLTTDMAREDLRPYFLWDEDVSIGELRVLLRGADSPRRDQLLAKMLREARDLDVWQFVRPVEVARVLERLRRRIGRRYPFWSFLIEAWRSRGLLRA
jgi:hypothetical protein